MFLSEASDNEYIVVDVIRDPGSPVELIFRYLQHTEPGPAAPKAAGP